MPVTTPGEWIIRTEISDQALSDASRRLYAATQEARLASPEATR